MQVPGVGRVAEPVTDRLEAVYFDTPTLALAARRITLRRRTGGNDHGWHLKLPAGGNQRRELHAPFGQPDTVPEELGRRVQVYTRGEGLVPVARLSTGRTTRRLYGLAGEHLADLADDMVHAETLHPAQRCRIGVNEKSNSSTARSASSQTPKQSLPQPVRSARAIPPNWRGHSGRPGRRNGWPIHGNRGTRDPQRTSSPPISAHRLLNSSLRTPACARKHRTPSTR